jgi:hypothetical protein
MSFSFVRHVICLLSGTALLLCLFPSVARAVAPANSGDGTFLLPFSDDAEMAKDFQALAPPFLPWGPNTSGPFFTGTAEVEPVGSWYLEPFAYDFINPSIPLPPSTCPCVWR